MWPVVQPENGIATLSPCWIDSSARKIAGTSGNLQATMSCSLLTKGYLGSSPEQFAILLSFKTCPLNGVGLVVGKAVPEIQREALIQQKLHAILESNESFASSSAWTAISRVTVGN